MYLSLIFPTKIFKFSISIIPIIKSFKCFKSYHSELPKLILKIIIIHGISMIQKQSPTLNIEILEIAIHYY